MHMKQYEHSVYSQAGQDGVIEHIFSVIGTTNKYFVEFGTVDGMHISNTANLRLKKGWSGLLMDADPTVSTVKQEFITAENIEFLFHRYDVPLDFDYLSIDIDGNDWWVWKAIERFSPRVVSIEFNSNFPADVSVTITYNRSHRWDGTKYFGASLFALTKLAWAKGYQLVHIVENLDAIFVRNDCMHGLKEKKIAELLPAPIPCFAEADNKNWIKI